MTEEFNEFGKKLRKYRKQRGFNQLDLELCANMAPGSISRIENQKINPSKETLYRIAIALNLNESELFDLFCIQELIMNKISPGILT